MKILERKGIPNLKAKVSTETITNPGDDIGNGQLLLLKTSEPSSGAIGKRIIVASREIQIVLGPHSVLGMNHLPSKLNPRLPRAILMFYNIATYVGTLLFCIHWRFLLLKLRARICNFCMYLITVNVFSIRPNLLLAPLKSEILLPYGECNLCQDLIPY